MLCSALCLLLLGIVWEMVVSSKRYMDNSDGKIALQGYVLRAIDTVNQEVTESDRFAISAYYDPDSTSLPPPSYLIFPSPRSLSNRISFDSQGRMLWRQIVCYYIAMRDGIPVLCRKAKVVEPPSTDPPPPPGVATLRDDATLNELIIAKNIEEFSPVLSPDGTVEVKVRGNLHQTIHSYGVELVNKMLPNN